MGNQSRFTGSHLLPISSPARITLRNGTALRAPQAADALSFFPDQVPPYRPLSVLPWCLTRHTVCVCVCVCVCVGGGGGGLFYLLDGRGLVTVEIYPTQLYPTTIPPGLLQEVKYKSEDPRAWVHLAPGDARHRRENEIRRIIRFIRRLNSNLSPYLRSEPRSPYI